MGVDLDDKLNQKAVQGKAEAVISRGKTAVLEMPTNEVKMIALDTKAIAYR